jgi:hypothetical protein
MHFENQFGNQMIETITGLVLKIWLKIWHFDFRTQIGHSKSKLVQFFNIDCIQ